MLATMTALATVLSTRALAMLAVTGAFVLALLAVLNPDYLKLAANGGFDLFVVVPTIILYLWRG